MNTPENQILPEKLDKRSIAGGLQIGRKIHKWTCVSFSGFTNLRVGCTASLEMRSTIFPKLAFQRCTKRFCVTVARSPADSLISVEMPFLTNKALGDSFVNVHNQVCLDIVLLLILRIRSESAWYWKSSTVCLQDRLDCLFISFGGWSRTEAHYRTRCGFGSRQWKV